MTSAIVSGTAFHLSAWACALRIDGNVLGMVVLLFVLLQRILTKYFVAIVISSVKVVVLDTLNITKYPILVNRYY